MELRINDYQVPESIEFNFDELKNEVAERVAFYKDLVYTDAQMKEAKADRARLRKVIDAIDAQRKKVKSDLLQPYTELETKLNEIKALIQEPIDMIDNQVKAYEELQKQTKTESIRQGWINKGGPVDISLIWNPKWLNTTYSMKKIGEEMDAAIENYNNGMTTLEQLTEYQFEAIEVFKATLDLGAAMVRANELKEQAKRKAEYEAEQERLRMRMKEQAEQNVDWQVACDPLYEKNLPGCEEEIKEERQEESESRFWVKFECCVSEKEAKWLRGFFEANGIEYKATV